MKRLLFILLLCGAANAATVELSPHYFSYPQFGGLLTYDGSNPGVMDTHYSISGGNQIFTLTRDSSGSKRYTHAVMTFSVGNASVPAYTCIDEMKILLIEYGSTFSGNENVECWMLRYNNGTTPAINMPTWNEYNSLTNNAWSLIGETNLAHFYPYNTDTNGLTAQDSDSGTTASGESVYLDLREEATAGQGDGFPHYMPNGTLNFSVILRRTVSVETSDTSASFQAVNVKLHVIHSGSLCPTNTVAPPSNTPTFTATPTNTPSQTPTPSNTITQTPTITRTPTQSRTPTRTFTVSQTPTITQTPSTTNTPSKTATVTNTPIGDTPTPTVTRTNTITQTPTRTATVTQTPTISQTPTKTATATPTNTLGPFDSKMYLLGQSARGNPAVAYYGDLKKLDVGEVNAQVINSATLDISHLDAESIEAHSSLKVGDGAVFVDSTGVNVGTGAVQISPAGVLATTGDALVGDNLTVEGDLDVGDSLTGTGGSGLFRDYLSTVGPLEITSSNTYLRIGGSGPSKMFLRHNSTARTLAFEDFDEIPLYTMDMNDVVFTWTNLDSSTLMALTDVGSSMGDLSVSGSVIPNKVIGINDADDDLILQSANYSAGTAGSIVQADGDGTIMIDGFSTGNLNSLILGSSAALGSQFLNDEDSGGIFMLYHKSGEYMRCSSNLLQCKATSGFLLGTDAMEIQWVTNSTGPSIEGSDTNDTIIFENGSTEAFEFDLANGRIQLDGDGIWINTGNTNNTVGIGASSGSDQVTIDADNGNIDTLGGVSLANVLNLGAGSTLTIGGDVVTITKSRHKISAESGVTDDLVTINGGTDGDLLLLSVTSGQTITLRSGADNIYCGADLAVGTDDQVLLTYASGDWLVVSYHNN